MKDQQNDQIKNIWTKFIDVQDQLLRLRQEPIPLIPDTIEINGHILKAKIDETCKTDIVIAKMKEVFGVDETYINLREGILATADITPNRDNINAFVEFAHRNYLKFYPNPSLSGVVKKEVSLANYITNDLKRNLQFDFDSRGRVQASISVFRQLDSVICNNSNIKLPDNAVGIFEIKPNLAYILSQQFKEATFTHQSYPYTNSRTGRISINRILKLHGKYFNKPTQDKLYEEVGLSLHKVVYTFYIHDRILEGYDKEYLCRIFGEEILKYNSVTFNVFPSETANNDSQKIEDDLFWEPEWNTDWDFLYSLHKGAFERVFGLGNFEFKTEFQYTYDISKFENDYLLRVGYSEVEFWAEINNISTSRAISKKEDRNIIGIDFNWREESLEKTICEVANEIGICNFSYYQNHRCNIDLSVEDVDLSSTDRMLKERFPSIRTEIDGRNGIMKFYQEYTPETKYKLHRMLCSEMSSLSDNLIVEFSQVLPQKDIYFFETDRKNQVEDIQTQIRELRGTDFEYSDLFLGKLIRVNFPSIILDVSDADVSKITQLAEIRGIDYMSPNLTGDIEKMHRLKDSLGRIVSGERLNNIMLSEYIFDSSKASPINEEEIAYKLNPRSDYYKEIQNNLLNKKINASQVDAVIKTLLSKDLAIIQGPPGTGKSTAIAEIIWQHIRKDQTEKILLTSETNLAVDNAIDRVKNRNNNLVKPIRFGDADKLEDEGRQFSIEAMKQWVESENKDRLSTILSDWITNIASRIGLDDQNIKDIWLNILKNPSKAQREWFYDNYIKGCNLIGATCSSIGDMNSKKKPTNFFKNYCEIFGKSESRENREGKQYIVYSTKNNKGIEFTTVIQDEASKATPAELSLPLIYGKKSIIIGDHRQLPPMLDREEFISSMEYLITKTSDRKEQNELEKLLKYVRCNFDELEISHFERLFTTIDDSLKGLFNLQYRMHPDINEVIKQFYIQDGGLECGLISPIDLGVNDIDMSNPASRYHGINIDGLLSDDNHVLWIDTSSPELAEGTSRVNYGEFDAIRWVLSKLQQSDSYLNYQNYWREAEDKQIGIISFYGKQLKLLDNLKKEYPDIPMRISTVDRFQGMERNIVIVSMVRSNCIANDKEQRPDTQLYGEFGYPIQNDLGFAKSPNRLNVALSRAKRLLIIVGNSQLFRQKSIYDNVYNTIAKNPNGRIIKYNHYDK